MDYCTVEYGGFDSYDSNINCNNASPTIQNCTIRYSDGYGIYCDNDSAPTLTNNTMSNNAIYPVTLFCGLLDSNVTGNTGSGNGTDAIEVRGGVITVDRTWVSQDFYFQVTGDDIHVYSSATLTINPGCLVKFDNGAALFIGYYSKATLIADGTSGSPITFTSSASTPAPGDWEGIVFFEHTDDSTTILDYCTVEYGGFNSYDSNIYCLNASPTIQRCVIRNSDGHGIYTTESNSLPSISCSKITDNVNGVYAESNSNPTVTDCSIAGNTSSGVTNTSSAITLDAENNWWGNASGPSGVGPGTGAAVSAYVDFSPWRTAFDSCLDTIVLTPYSETNFIGSQHTVTATVETVEGESTEPIEGIVLFFYITSGPHAGVNGNDTTDANGQATFTYTGTTEGTDTIEASFSDFYGRTTTSNSVTKTWEAPATPLPTPSPSPSPETTPTPTATATVTPTPSPEVTPTPTPSPAPTPVPTPEIINDLVLFEPIKLTYATTSDTTGCPPGFVGKFSFDAKLTNKGSSPSLLNLAVQVKTLTNGNLLHNADGGNGGEGSIMTIPLTGAYADGVLSPGEFVNVPFVICLKEKKSFKFIVDVLGVENDVSSTALKKTTTEPNRAKFKKRSKVTRKGFFGRFRPQ